MRLDWIGINWNWILRLGLDGSFIVLYLYLIYFQSKLLADIIHTCFIYIYSFELSQWYYSTFSCSNFNQGSNGKYSICYLLYLYKLTLRKKKVKLSSYLITVRTSPGPNLLVPAFKKLYCTDRTFLTSSVHHYDTESGTTPLPLIKGVNFERTFI